MQKNPQCSGIMPEAKFQARLLSRLETRVNNVSLGMRALANALERPEKHDHQTDIYQGDLSCLFRVFSEYLSDAYREEDDE